MGPSSRFPRASDPNQQSVVDFYIAISSLLYNMGQGAVWTFIRTQIYDLQGSFLEIMLISSIPSLFGFLFSGLWGRLSDIKFSKKSLIIFGYMSTSIITLFLIFSDTPIQLILIYTILAFFGVSYAPALNALISSTKGGRQGTRVGWYTTIFSIGSTMGSIFGGYLAYNYGYDVVYIFSSLVGVIGALFMFKYCGEEVVTNSLGGGIRDLMRSLSMVSVEESMRYLVVAYSIQTFAGATFYNLYTIIYYELLERNTFLYGLFNGIAGLGSILAPRLYGGAIDKFDGKRVYVITSLIYTPYFMALTYFRNIYIVTFLWFLPLWPGVYLPALATATRISGEERSGTYQGILNTYASMSRVLGPLIGGIIADYLGARRDIDALNIFLYIISILPSLSAFMMRRVKS